MGKFASDFKESDLQIQITRGVLGLGRCSVVSAHALVKNNIEKHCLYKTGPTQGLEKLRDDWAKVHD